MDIRADIRTSRDLLAKLQREAERFEQEPIADHLLNFMVTAWSLLDWITEETGRTPEWENLREDPSLQFCRAIATSSKHAIIRNFPKSSPPVVTKVTRQPPARFGETVLGLSVLGGGGDYIIEVAGNSHSARDVLDNTLTRYDLSLVFRTHLCYYT